MCVNEHWSRASGARVDQSSRAIRANRARVESRRATNTLYEDNSSRGLASLTSNKHE